MAQAHRFYSDHFKEHASPWSNDETNCREDRASDQGLFLLVTQGPGAPFLRSGPEPGTYACDLDFLKNYGVRDGFESYGGCLVIDEQKPLYITNGRTKTTPGSSCWSKEKYRFRASLFVHAWIMLHQCLHVRAGLPLFSAAFGELAPSHPLFRLVRPFIEKNHVAGETVKYVAGTPRGINIRMVGLDSSSLDRFMADTLESMKIAPFDDTEVQWTPYFQDGVLIWGALHKFVDQYLHHYNIERSSPDVEGFVRRLQRPLDDCSLSTLITTYIFYNTYMHSIWGNVHEFAWSPFLHATTIRKGDQELEYSDSVETSIFKWLVFISTSRTNDLSMLGDSYAYLGLDDGGIRIFRDLANDLEAVERSIIDRNKARVQPFMTSLPSRIWVSTGV